MKEIYLNFEITNAYNSVCYNMLYIMDFLKKKYKIVLNEKNINKLEFKKLLEHLDITEKNIEIEEIQEADYNFLISAGQYMKDGEGDIYAQFEGNFITPVIHNARKDEKYRLFSNTYISYIHLYQRIKSNRLYELNKSIISYDIVFEPLKTYEMKKEAKNIDMLIVGKHYKYGTEKINIENYQNVVAVRANRDGTANIKEYTDGKGGKITIIDALLKQREINELMSKTKIYYTLLKPFDSFNQTIRYAILNDCKIYNPHYIPSIFPNSRIPNKAEILEEIQESKRKIEAIIKKEVKEW